LKWGSPEQGWLGRNVCHRGRAGCEGPGGHAGAAQERKGEASGGAGRSIRRSREKH